MKLSRNKLFDIQPDVQVLPLRIERSAVFIIDTLPLWETESETNKQTNKRSGF